MKELLSKMQTLRIPFDVTFELTYKCNLKCKHCYQDNSDDNMILKTNEVFNILDQLAKAGCFNLAFTGGEIFSRKDIFQIVERANELNFALDLFTNGTLITKDVAKDLAKYKIRRVEISIHGSTPDIHDEFTKVKGSFNRIIEAVNHLKDNDVNILLKTPITSDNINDINNILCLCKTLNVKHSFSSLIYPTINGNLNPLGHRIDDAKLDAIAQLDFNLNISDKSSIEIYRNFIYPQNTKKEVCGAATRIANISPKGDVTPCIITPFVLGNLRQASFNDIWNNSEKVKEYREKVENGFSDECKECNLSNICTKCLGLSLLEHNDLSKKSSEICRITHSLQKVLNSYKEKIDNLSSI